MWLSLGLSDQFSLVIFLSSRQYLAHIDSASIPDSITFCTRRQAHSHLFLCLGARPVRKLRSEHTFKRDRPACPITKRPLSIPPAWNTLPKPQTIARSSSM